LAPGALGSVIGGTLAEAGNDVLLVNRKPLARLKRSTGPV